MGCTGPHGPGREAYHLRHSVDRPVQQASLVQAEGAVPAGPCSSHQRQRWKDGGHRRVMGHPQGGQVHPTPQHQHTQRPSTQQDCRSQNLEETFPDRPLLPADDAKRKEALQVWPSSLTASQYGRSSVPLGQSPIGQQTDLGFAHQPCETLGCMPQLGDCAARHLSTMPGLSLGWDVEHALKGLPDPSPGRS